jgi:GcrA cell cycle regulator
MSGIWTQERIEMLQRLWQEGRSASQIAEELGGISRNAVIGKAHRLELTPRPSPIKREEKKPRRAPAAQGCLWPIGDPRTADFHFCGEDPAPGRPYCMGHCAMAYQRRDEAAA